MQARELRTPQERTRYVFALVFSILVWIVVVVSLVGALYAVLIALGIVIGHALFLAHIHGNGVRLGPDQMPELWQRVEKAAKKLGLATTPETYVIQAGGMLNAFATKLFARKFVIIYADLVDACEAINPSLDRTDSEPTELDFVIAHEIGHIACGHLTWLLLPARIVPLLGPAYSRACEYTCDRCGASVVGSPEVSMRALSILAGGGQLSKRMNLTAFADQRKTTGRFWAAVYELNASHPYLCKRVAALRERYQPGAAPAGGRNILAYPLAPAFSIFAGGAGAASSMTVIVIVAVMAAVAIPAFANYMEKAKAARGELLSPDQSFAIDDEPLTRPGLEADDSNGFVKGELFPWRMRVPGPSWQAIPQAQARQQNPMADGWLMRSDIDAHIMVIAEKVPGEHTLDEYLPVIIDNARKSGSGYELIEKTPISVPGGEGVVLHSKNRIGEYDMEYLTGVRLSHGHLFQIIGFAAAGTFTGARQQFADAIESFEVSTAATSQD